MPEISRFFGIKINMYWDDHNPPHFHAKYGEHEAVFDIQTGEKMSGRFPNTGRKLVEDWIRQNKVELLDNWERARQGQPLNKLRGLI